jgi:hypothetical protein
MDHSTDLIRKAVVAGEFERALLLWNGYAGRLRKELRGDSRSAARLAEARDLVEWSRRTVRCAHAHAQDRMNGLRIARDYSEPVPPQAPRIIVTRF